MNHYIPASWHLELDSTCIFQSLFDSPQNLLFQNPEFRVVVSIIALFSDNTCLTRTNTCHIFWDVHWTRASLVYIDYFADEIPVDGKNQCFRSSGYVAPRNAASLCLYSIKHSWNNIEQLSRSNALNIPVGHFFVYLWQFYQWTLVHIRQNIYQFSDLYRDKQHSHLC